MGAQYSGVGLISHVRQVMPAMLIGPPALRQSLSHSYTHKCLLDPLLPRMTSGVLFYTTGHSSYVSQNYNNFTLCTSLHSNSATHISNSAISNSATHTYNSATHIFNSATHISNSATITSNLVTQPSRINHCRH
jgi:hypothetical protein